MNIPQINNPKNYQKKFLIAALIVLNFFFLAIGLFLGYNSHTDTAKSSTLGQVLAKLAPENKAVDFTLLEKVWEEVRAKYVKQPVDEQKLLYGALAGLVDSLGDPYSNYLDPQLSQQFMNEIGGSFEGIGIEIGRKNDQLTVIAPLDGSPAEKAGLSTGDIILSINGQSTSEISLDYATSLIRGKKGTEVKLQILPEGEDAPKEISIIRDKIKIVSVSWETKTLADSRGNIGYINISSFTEDTVDKFDQAVNALKIKDVRGIVLDLRNNPGGYLDAAIGIASNFVEDGVVVIEEHSDKTRKEYRAEGQASLDTYPTVVLINEGSASSSEIVAGALKDQGIATLVGLTSYGKGSVQEFEELSDGSSLKLTTARWLTPKGNSIDGQGIQPDVTIKLTEDDYDNDRDPQLDEAMKILSEKININ